jgi:hypothetical protein
VGRISEVVKQPISLVAPGMFPMTMFAMTVGAPMVMPKPVKAMPVSAGAISIRAIRVVRRGPGIVIRIGLHHVASDILGKPKASHDGHSRN